MLLMRNGEDGRIVDPEEIREFIETLDKHGIRQLVISLSVSVKVTYIRGGVMAHAIAMWAVFYGALA